MLAPNFAHIVHKPMPKNEIAFELEPLATSHRGFESRPALLRVAANDRTSSIGDREYAARCSDIRTRQWRDLDASTVGDVAHDDRLADCLRKGMAPAEVGKVLLQLVHERVESIVRSSAA